MNLINLKYKLESEYAPVLDSCCLSRNDEQGESIKNALNSLDVQVDYDEDWGFVKIISVNGIPLVH